jgi:ligand-binding sensor domain-containing protein/anti-sigma regulatory factor (Ser/Thr protein kinase)
MNNCLRLFFYLLIVFCCTLTVSAQDYSYAHYDVQDGMAGANVYAVYQDPQKFLWFGTETGVSRFDGTHFKNFTTADGLPDNEILEIYGDEDGKVWFVPFKKTICYYYKGKIHNQQNDSVLQKIQIHSNVLSVCVDKYKNTWILEEKGLFLITPQKTIHYYEQINNHPLNGSLFIGLNSNKELILQWENQLYTYQGNRFTFLFSIDYPLEYRGFKNIHISGDYIVWRSGKNSACAQSLSSGEMHCFSYPDNALRFSSPGNGTIAISSTNGVSIYNPASKKEEYYFLKNISVSKVLIDHEGSWWFTTLGEGVYQLLSTEYKNYKPWGEGNNQEIFSLSEVGDKILMGTNFGKILFTSDDFKKPGTFSFPSNVINKYDRITCLAKLPSGKVLIGSDEHLALLNTNLQLEQLTGINSIKNIYYVNDDSVFIATSNDTRLISLKDITQFKKVWSERSTAVCLYKGTLFVGTLNGLYHLPAGKLPVYMGEYDTLFTRRISSMVVSKDTTLWVATYDGGIVGMKKGMVRDTFTTKEGLTSNICRNLVIDDNVLWVGTDKGVSRIDLNVKPHRVTPFTVNDGLLSNQVNAIYKDNDTVFVACQEGITYFDITKVFNTSQCNLEITNVYQGTGELPIQAKYEFKSDQNNFKVEFVGISFKSTGDITYQYKMDGLDTIMKSTKETTLEFLSLPPGNYELQLIALNKFGVKSNLKKIAIIINPAFYQTKWFFILAILASAVITLLLVLLYNQYKRSKREKEQVTTKRISELEQMALRAQMNPHFIFNCLNSIQQFVYDKDIQSANRFISGFAKLIRQTLDNSAKSTITVADEVEYLNSYLTLEKIRFENKFDYHISVDPSIKQEEYKIPVMLLQPYVENSIRHGIRYKKDGEGHIDIRFTADGGFMHCSIEDDGIGREKARELKSRQHIEYQSKGMLLTGERIEAINKSSAEKISIEVIDLYKENGEAAGTKILIHFPISLVQNN